MLTREELGTVTPGPSRDGQVIGEGCVVGDGMRDGTSLVVARIVVEDGEIEAVLAAVCCTEVDEEIEEGVGCGAMDVVVGRTDKDKLSTMRDEAAMLWELEPTETAGDKEEVSSCNSEEV